MASNNKIRSFVEYWKFQRGSEKGEDVKFWNMLLRDVLGMNDVEQRVAQQVPVQMKGTTKWLDFWIPETRVLIEHKSRGVNLDAPQAGHGGKTPFQQALEYNQARGFSDKARWIVTSNFDEIWVYDMDRPLDDPQKIRLVDLSREVSRLSFLVDTSVKSVRDKEKDISIKAGYIVGELYKALLARYAKPNSPVTLKALNRLCVRLVFLFYAEDADIFQKDAFWHLLNETPARFVRDRLIKLMQTLDTPDSKRDQYLEQELKVFPYTNGGLFRGVLAADIPLIDDEIRELLIRSSNFDWCDISPTIFGALFESTLNPATRRAGGMVYTSVENIHKVIDPLFLNDFTRRVDECLAMVPSSSRNKQLLALQSEIASLTFLDPACGSGNFLTETYICLRRLENRIIAAMQGGQRELDLGLSVKVSIAQFYGIEINDFAVAVAKTALWIAEAQMLRETAEILHREPDYLPLKEYSNIVEGNALRMDWPITDYIIGNPPFVGHQHRTRDQKADMDVVFADRKDTNYGKLDYVCAWFKKAAKLDARCALVATNSICQGESVAAMWKPLFKRDGVEIDFAHRTFRWDNEASDKAHVHCVIVGFHSSAVRGTKSVKTLYDDNTVIPAKHINGYLIDAPDVFIESRGRVKTPGLAAMRKGSQPTDGGKLLLSPTERDEILSKWPAANSFILRFTGADEYINNDLRFCLWLKDVAPNSYRHIPPIMKRLADIAKKRRESPTESVQRAAETPMLFTQIRQPNTDYLLIPRHSSGERKYIPIGFVPANVIVGDAAYFIPDASPYTFGVLTSSTHMAWMRIVVGRIKSDYRYTPAVYNNFPWPYFSEKNAYAEKDKISATARVILDVRARYPDSSLADLYDQLTMPADLRAAHSANDKAVLAAYGLAPDTPEPEIVAHLFRLYVKRTKKS